jgi:hypothetical protein
MNDSIYWPSLTPSVIMVPSSFNPAMFPWMYMITLDHSIHHHTCVVIGCMHLLYNNTVFQCHRHEHDDLLCCNLQPDISAWAASLLLSTGQVSAFGTHRQADLCFATMVLRILVL